jgi:hypothetical protein
MMQRSSAKIPYLLKAYRLAKLENDKQELVFTAHSLARLSPFDDIFAFFEAEKSKNTNVFGG